MSSKDTSLIEKFRLALTSTVKVISDDFALNDKDSKNKNSKNTIEIDNLTNPSDFIRLRAETDSGALKKNFLMMLSIKKTFQQILYLDRSTILLKK